MGAQRENAAEGRREDAARGHRESERWHDVERMANPERSLFEAPNPALEGVHRGSPLSLVTGVVSGLGVALGVSLVAIVRVIGGDVVEELPGIAVAAALLIAASVVSAVVTWRTRTWELTDAGIMLCSGLVNARRLQVPYEHIHTVNMSSSLMERVLGIMTLDLDTGAADTEGQVTSIKGLQAGVAEALREELFRRKAAALAGQDLAPAVEGMSARQATGDSPVDPTPACDTPDKAPDACVTLGPARLVLAALTETRVIAQAAAFLILIVQGINFLQESRLVNLSEAAGDIAALPIALLAAVAGLLLALSLIIGFAISFAISLISFAGYRAERRGGRITVERGLLGRTSHAVASERIQSLRIRQGLVRQLLGYAEVRASVVGSIGSSDESSTTDGMVLHPFIHLSELDAFLEAIVPEFAGAPRASDLARLPRAAARRLAVRTSAKAVLLAAVLAGSCALAGGALPSGEPWATLRQALAVVFGVVGVAVALRMVVGAVLRYRDSRIGHDRTRLVMVVGGIKRWTEVVPRSRLQHVTASESPFQRRVRVATCVARTAAMGDLALRDVSVDDAEGILAWVRPRRSDGDASQG